MKNVLIVVVMVLLFLLIQSCSIGESDKPYKLVVKIHETDCFSCMQANALLRDLSEIAEIEIIFDGLNDESIDGFMNSNSMGFLKESSDVEIISNSDEYNLWDKTSAISEGFLFDNQGFELFCFQFRMDEQMMRHLLDICQEGKEIMQANKVVKLQSNYNNDGVDFLVKDNYYVLLNRPMNLCQIFNLNGQLIREIEGDSIDSQMVFPELVVFDGVMKELKQNGLLRSSVEDVFILDKEIWIGCRVPYPEMRSNEIFHHSYYEVLSYSLLGDKQDYEVLYDGRMDSVTSISFDKGIDGVVDALLFRIRQDSLVCYTMAQCQRNDGMFRFNDEKPINYPPFVKNQYLLHSPKLKDRMLNVYFTDFLLDVKTDSVYSLPFQCNAVVKNAGQLDMKLQMDARLVDWSYDGIGFGLIYKDMNENKYYYLSGNIGCDCLSKSELNDGNVSNVKYQLQSPRLIRYLDKQNEVHTIIARKWRG